jgi:ADP-heptose:LPS heptosyltransferase
MHIAVALGVPTVGIFGPGEDDIWFPYEPASGHRALRKNVPCHPCRLDVCNRTGDGYMECMRLLSVGEVFETAERILAR